MYFNYVYKMICYFVCVLEFRKCFCWIILWIINIRILEGNNKGMYLNFDRVMWIKIFGLIRRYYLWKILNKEEKKI